MPRSSVRKIHNVPAAGLALSGCNQVNATPAEDAEVGAGTPVIIVDPGLGASLEHNLHCVGVRGQKVPRVPKILAASPCRSVF